MAIFKTLKKNSYNQLFYFLISLVDGNFARKFLIKFFYKKKPDHHGGIDYESCASTLLVYEASYKHLRKDHFTHLSFALLLPTLFYPCLLDLKTHGKKQSVNEERNKPFVYLLYRSTSLPTHNCIVLCWWALSPREEETLHTCRIVRNFVFVLHQEPICG